uniref:Uncharacterized protein n=1 Tax=Pygocentrus nattereri TaxID=42514 RepID=A0A3B4E290_PYGNA
MCTTMMVLSTLALLLRRHFFNRVRPILYNSVDGKNGGKLNFIFVAEQTHQYLFMFKYL